MVKLIKFDNNHTLSEAKALTADNPQICYLTTDGYVVFNNIVYYNEYNKELDKKQNKLISGTNIKTINGEDLLGEGNLKINSIYDLGRFYRSIDGENEAKKLGICNNLDILYMKYEVYGLESVIATITQHIEDNTTKQELYLKGTTFKRTITFTDATRQTISSVSDWVKYELEVADNKVQQITNSTTQYPSAKAVYDELQNKQDTLVSGTNIKTVNGNSLLGSGNIEIQGGSDINVIDNLTSTSTTDALSANMGRVLKEKVDEIELFKSPNATIIGNPTIEHGQVSGFSKEPAAYLTLPFSFDSVGKKFELNLAFTTGSDVNTPQNIIGSSYCMAIYIEQGKLNVRISNNGTSWDVWSYVHEGLTFVANHPYYVKLTYTGINYNLKLSENGKDYIDLANLGATKYPYKRLIYLGIGNNFNNPFKGIINLNKCSLLFNDEHFWEGMDDAGLATRLATDLSNIDDEGKQVVKDIVKEDFVTKPQTPGTNGQVLTSNGDGTQSWKDAQGGGTISEDLFYMLAGNDQYIIWEDVDGNIHRTFQKLGQYINTTGIRLNDKVKKILVGGLEKNETSLYCMLNGCPNLEEFMPILNTENITRLDATFVDSSDKLYINGLEKWNTSKVTLIRGLLPIVSNQVNVLNKLDFRKVTEFGTVGGGVLYGSKGLDFLDIEIDFSEILMPSLKSVRISDNTIKINKLKMFGVPCIYDNGKFNSGAILNYSACVNAEVIEFPQKCPLLFDGVNITLVDGALYSPLDLYYEQDKYFNMSGKEDVFINALGTFVVDESVGSSEYNYLCVENPNDGSKLPLAFLPTIKLNSTRKAALTDAQKEIIANKGWTII